MRNRWWTDKGDNTPVCYEYCYSMLMPRDSIDPFRQKRAVQEWENRFHTQPNRESTPTLPLFFAGQRGDVARRSRLWNATSSDPSRTDRSNLSSVYHRNKTMRKKNTVRYEEKKRKREKEEWERKKKKERNCFIASMDDGLLWFFGFNSYAKKLISRGCRL